MAHRFDRADRSRDHSTDAESNPTTRKADIVYVNDVQPLDLSSVIG
jgi:hypothetical protein